MARLRRLLRRMLRPFTGYRTVLVERNGKHSALMQSKRLGFWCTFGHTAEFAEFPALLMELGDIYAEIRRMQGRKMSRQQARHFARKVARSV